jgi:hypothetical protein
MESVGIASTSLGSADRSPSLLFPTALSSFGLLVAVMTIGAFSSWRAISQVTGRSGVPATIYTYGGRADTQG